jgi:hypothetical protein
MLQGAQSIEENHQDHQDHNEAAHERTITKFLTTVRNVDIWNEMEVSGLGELRYLLRYGAVPRSR